MHQLKTAETLEPDVKITGLSILSPGRPDMVLRPLPPEPKSKEPWFTLKEGSAYRLKFTFIVAGNIVSGLRYTNTVWKTGIRGTRTPYITCTHLSCLPWMDAQAGIVQFVI
jgi:Rho GDP-dissociation inhibitor